MARLQSLSKRIYDTESQTSLPIKSLTIIVALLSMEDTFKAPNLNRQCEMLLGPLHFMIPTQENLFLWHPSDDRQRNSSQNLNTMVGQVFETMKLFGTMFVFSKDQVRQFLLMGHIWATIFQ